MRPESELCPDSDGHLHSVRISGRAPPSGARPSVGSRPIARELTPRDRAAFGVSAHPGHGRSRDQAARSEPQRSPPHMCRACSAGLAQLVCTCEAPLVSAPLTASLPARHFVPYSPGRPSPPSMVRRCGSRRLRGNPPAAGPPLRCGPARRKRRLGASGAWAAAIPRTPAGE